MPTGGIRFVPVALAVALGVAAVGCGGGSHDRAGGKIAPKTVVLTLATHESGTGVREWVDAVRRLSHGSLRIVVKGGWRRREADYEKATIADVRAGKAQPGEHSGARLRHASASRTSRDCSRPS